MGAILTERFVDRSLVLGDFDKDDPGVRLGEALSPLQLADLGLG